MAYYVLEYRYTDADRRAAARPKHLDYMQRLHAEGHVVMAGPIGDGTGAMVIYRAEGEAEVRELVAEDPYTHAGVTTDITLRPWSVVVGAPGGE